VTGKGVKASPHAQHPRPRCQKVRRCELYRRDGLAVHTNVLLESKVDILTHRPDGLRTQGCAWRVAYCTGGRPTAL
jgi:hypothetical protein